MIDEKLLIKAKWAALLEQVSRDDPKRLIIVASALLDAVEYALKEGIIDESNASLPDELDGLLEKVYECLHEDK